MPATVSGPSALAPEPSVAPQSRSGDDTRVVGGLLVVFGTGWILRQSGAVAISWPALLAAVLVALGAAMVVTARTNRRSRGLIALGVALTLVVVSTSSVADLKLGELDYRPTSVASLAREYDAVAGNVTVDLTRVRDMSSVDAVPVDASVMVGELTVVVPADVELRVHGNVGLGKLVVAGRPLGDGLGISETFRSSRYGRSGVRRVDVDANVLVGSIEVRRAR